jgi:ribosomal protein L11 methyltransferase
MKWIELEIQTTEQACDAVSYMLMSIGAGGVAIEDSDEIKVKAYFAEDRNIGELKELVKEKLIFISNFLNIGQGTIEYSRIDDEDWSQTWKKHYKPFAVSSNVVVKPTWEHYEKKGNEVVIEIDPGMAFGTGTHETTSMCVKLLERYFKKGNTLIDVGSGTGILSIAAAKLGASRVTAIDVDEIAVRMTRENCLHNHVEDIVEAHEGTLENVNVKKSDVIVANIIADVIIDLAKIMNNYLNKDGLLITSGIIKERRDQVIETYIQKGFDYVDIMETGEWAAMVFKCQNSL